MGAWCAAGVACGGSEEFDGGNGTTGCGPHGSLHQSYTGNLHCHCDQGFQEVDGICVEDLAASPPSPPASEPTLPSDPCWPNSTFDGAVCRCDEGYTLIGDVDSLSCASIPACQGENDGFEPNDSPGQGSDLRQVPGDLYACPADEDWLVFSVNAGDRVTAQIQFDGDAVDLDLFMFEPGSLDPAAFAVEAVGDSETANFVSRATGTAALLVIPYGVGEGAYLLEVDIEAGEAPTCASPGQFCQRASDCCSNICHIGHCH